MVSVRDILSESCCFSSAVASLKSDTIMRLLIWSIAYMFVCFRWASVCVNMYHHRKRDTLKHVITIVSNYTHASIHSHLQRIHSHENWWCLDNTKIQHSASPDGPSIPPKTNISTHCTVYTYAFAYIDEMVVVHCDYSVHMIFLRQASSKHFVYRPKDS